MGSVPARFPPPFKPQDALAVPGDADPIEVGIVVVGAGPAGLACAIRLGQLAEEDPETAERLGEVPVAVLEKGKQPGSHLLSGAVVNPRGLQRLFKGRKRIDEFPFLGEVAHESVYFMTPKHSFRIPTPPSMRNHGNYVASVSQLGRFFPPLTARKKHCFFGKLRERGAGFLPQGASPPNRSIGVREKIARNSGRFGICLAHMRPPYSGRRLLRCDKPETQIDLPHDTLGKL